MRKLKITPLATLATQIPAGQELDVIESDGILYVPFLGGLAALAGGKTAPAASDTTSETPAPAAPAAGRGRGKAAAAPAATAKETPAPAAPAAAPARGRGAAKKTEPTLEGVQDVLSKVETGDIQPDAMVAALVALGAPQEYAEAVHTEFMDNPELKPEEYAPTALAILKGEAPEADAGGDAAQEELDVKTLKKDQAVYVYLDETIVDPPGWYAATVDSIGRGGVTFLFEDDGEKQKYDAEHMKVAPR